ncbi:MAG TPA: redoxin domain-containing protein [Acidimicrobiia bacterium]|nr:redoxin domain-containing protein [Acidimicrobiia bacterium]
MGQMTDRIRSLGAEPVAVAVTATFSQMAFAESLGVDFPLLSDWEGTTANRYGVQYAEWKGHSGLAKRSVFLIGREGTVRYRWVTDDALIEPDFAEVLAVLETLPTTTAGGGGAR